MEILELGCPRDSQFFMTLVVAPQSPRILLRLGIYKASVAPDYAFFATIGNTHEHESSNHATREQVINKSYPYRNVNALILALPRLENADAEAKRG